MKALSLITGFAAFALCANSAMAGSVSVSFTNGNQLVTKTGGRLPTGAAVRVGTFTVPGADPMGALAKTSDLALLKSWFKPLGEGISGAGTVSQVNGSGNLIRVNDFPAAGNVFGSIANISDAYMAPGTPLYIWVFDNAVPEQSSQWGIFTGASWSVPQTLGVQTLASALSVGALQGTSVAGVLSLSVPTPSMGNWKLKYFSAGTAASAMSNAADPDGDGIPNLAEYAWHLNPNAKNNVPTSLINDGTVGGKFHFLSPKTLPDVQVVAECSTDLKTWTTASSTIVSTDSDFDTCECTVPNGATKCFWRVRINPIPPP